MEKNKKESEGKVGWSAGGMPFVNHTQGAVVLWRENVPVQQHRVLTVEAQKGKKVVESLRIHSD